MRLTRYLTNAQGNTAQLRENESYRKNEDSEGNSYTFDNSYTLIQKERGFGRQ